ncbi:hotdog family protein [Saccharopolyspora mangrovi]|uniref:Beta-ketoacyl synthase n=1 Tax=Saccharopolyspora mangrovi TaxID=3082379 RepID=A0ABU6AHF0_9PSEU|nr:beta-ketoacyl synthase [Saccharopolyspora sp. S2-29]MEB3370984.1 beta-ketoacyl synthase [Saccharopolyspora sp. S2-29]
MTNDLEGLGFDGEPFDPFAAPPAGEPPAPAASQTGGNGGADNIGAVAREMRRAVADAHRNALHAQVLMQARTLSRWGVDIAAPTVSAAASGYYEIVNGRITPSTAPPTAQTPPPVTTEARFKPLARTERTTLDRDDLARLADGDISGVFGPGYLQPGCNPSVKLAAGTALLLDEVGGIGLRGGSSGHGALVASVARLDGTPEQLLAAGEQAAEIFALYLGLHLCLADAVFSPGDGSGEPARSEAEITTGLHATEVRLDVTGVDLVPRPHVRADVEFRAGDEIAARITGLCLALVEKPGVPIGPDRGGTVPAFLGRYSAAGEQTLINEFHIAHFARGSHGIAFGPEFEHYSDRRATRVPDRGLTLVDRLVSMDGRRGELDGASYETEYDSPADSWYYADTANASMPNMIYMETSLQSALSIGYFLGPTLSAPQAPVSLRNLGGTATVLREVDLRDKTLRQRSQLLSTTLNNGASLQSFAYTLLADGEPFYEGETLFGYFSEEAMANQTGLDAGRAVPTWLDAQQPRPAVRTIDVAARRADPAAALCARDHFALLDDLHVVDGGGRYGNGYLHAVRRIDPDDWFFARHFPRDPVIPGSLGVETVIHAMQEWLLDAGLGEGMTNPGFILPVGAPFTWKYRGQFVPTDGQATLEVHIKDVRRGPGRVRVTGDASMWKPGLRIYELTDIAVELREEGARPW